MSEVQSLVNELQDLSDNLNLTVDNCPELVRQKFWFINAQQELHIIKDAYGDLLQDEIDIDNIISRAMWLEELVEDLLSDDNFLIELEWGGDFNFKAALKKINDSLKINLELGNKQALRQQIQQIKLIEEQLREIQFKLDRSIQIFENSLNVAEAIKIIMYFLEESVFSIEGYNQKGELLIAYTGQVKTVKSILEDDCEVLKRFTNALIRRSSNLRKQAEQSIKQLEEERRQEAKIQRQPQRQQSTTSQDLKFKHNGKQKIREKNKKRGSSVGWILILSTLTISGLGYIGWKSEFQLSQVQQMIASLGIPLNNDDKEQNTATEPPAKPTLKPEPVLSEMPETDQTLINWETAQRLAMEAAVMTQNPPHPLEVWQRSQAKWQEAIKLLEGIGEDSPISIQAKDKLAVYEASYAAISNRIVTEQRATANLEAAQKLAWQAAVLSQNPPHPPEVWQQVKAKWQDAINLLEAIPEGTFVSLQAKEKLSVYRNNYATVSKK